MNEPPKTPSPRLGAAGAVLMLAPHIVGVGIPEGTLPERPVGFVGVLLTLIPNRPDTPGFYFWKGGFRAFRCFIGASDYRHVCVTSTPSRRHPDGNRKKKTSD